MNFLNYVKLARIEKPLAILFLFAPCILGIVLANKINPIDINYFYYLSLFLVGSILMRSAGCVINDLIDVKYDKKVSRTKNRILASDKISKKSAIIFTILLLAPSLLILLQLNFKAIIIGLFSFVLILLYPYMKRITYYPQVFLGITFNIGCIISFIAINNELRFEALLLYLALILWTLLYDTIYAFQDLEDDIKIGVKSSAIIFKNNPKKILKILNFIIFLIFIFIGYSLNFRFEYYLAILVADLYSNKLIQSCDFNEPSSCLKTFKNNIFFILIIILAFVIS